MADATFTPYWKPLSEGSGPNSWVFYAVAKIAGCHRPVAVVSSVGTFEEESLHGPPLVACCRRIVTIFSDPANHTAIRGELGLASLYYAENGDVLDRHCPEPVELPELTRKNPGDPRRWRPWDRAGMQPFPFISAALLQGVALDPARGRSAPNRPEPLGTVYRDTDIEWGMVVFDITDLNAVRYGIVGFTVGMAKFVRSVEEGRPRFQGASFQPEEGPLRVLEEVRPRKAMSAGDYMAKFKYTGLVYEASDYDYDMERLASLPLVDDTAFSLVWPSGGKDDDNNLLLLANLSVSTQGPEGLTQKTLKQIIGKTIRESSHLDDLDVSVFDEVRNLGGFKDTLRQYLLQNSEKVGNTLSAGRLIRLAFVENGHLGLEQLKTLSAQSVSAALGDRLEADDTIKSISLCIESVRSTPAQLAEALSRSSGLREICLLQSPIRESDTLSAQLLAELASRPQILSCTRVIFTGAYSAALRKKFWLPTSINFTTLDIFPVQQIFVRYQRRSGRSFRFHYDAIHLSDGLLRPERFAAGFCLWISMLEWKDEWMFEDAAPFFSFSSGPASLSDNPLSAAEVSPILCENLSLPHLMPDHTFCAPRARDLVPGGWTVLVSQEQNVATQTDGQTHIRYAFIRVRGPSVVIEDPPSSPPGPENLEVVGLKGFLSATASEVDPAIIDQRLEDTRKSIKAEAAYRGSPWPAQVEPLSVLTQGEAAAMLLEFLGDARKRNEKFRKAMEGDPESEPGVFPLS
ncbi:hypothetical protein JX266_007691 [Neoarthrinium moseri]|nr:hypothetical protein JX266_007691 [Neoarthrinium moseri]